VLNLPDLLPLVPDWAPNIHPMLVHFPIAWWIAAVLVDLISLTLPRATWTNTVASTLYPAGAIAATVTYLTGRQAAMAVQTPGMAYPIVLEHWNWALATMVGFWLVTVLRLAVNLKHPQPPRWARIALAATALVALASLFETGERGARLVFEHGVGVSARH
jgi:uncharacterized membrane protein